MINALLTIDDIPSKNTPAIVDYLSQNGIKAILFAIGKYVEKNFDEAVYALQKGMIIGNHSYSHLPFSSLSYEECITDIQKCEDKIEELYKVAGIERLFKPFRFPFGDKGGENYKQLQKYLKENNFDKVDDSEITYQWYRNANLNSDIDTLWTYDFEEFRIQFGSSFSKEDALRKMNENNPIQGAPLFLENSRHILLMHAHDETEKIWPKYYQVLIGLLIEKGVIFDIPKFRNITT